MDERFPVLVAKVDGRHLLRPLQTPMNRSLPVILGASHWVGRANLCRAGPTIQIANLMLCPIAKGAAIPNIGLMRSS